MLSWDRFKVPGCLQHPDLETKWGQQLLYCQISPTFQRILIRLHFCSALCLKKSLYFITQFRTVDYFIWSQTPVQLIEALCRQRSWFTWKTWDSAKCQDLGWEARSLSSNFSSAGEPGTTHTSPRTKMRMLEVVYVSQTELWQEVWRRHCLRSTESNWKEVIILLMGSKYILMDSDTKQNVLSWTQYLAQGEHWDVSQRCSCSGCSLCHHLIWPPEFTGSALFTDCSVHSLTHYLFPECFTFCSALEIPAVGQAWVVIHYFIKATNMYWAPTMPGNIGIKMG